MSSQKRAMLIFTRIPVPGKVKTRLLSQYTPQACADIQLAMVKDLINKLSLLATNEVCDVYLCFSDEGDPEAFLKTLPQWLKVFPQKGQEMGERMYQGFELLFDEGYEQIVLTGSDIPTLQLKDILDAFSELNQSTLVIGPSCDGGYYLLGANSVNLSPIFMGSDMQWGHRSVYEQTVSNSHLQGWTMSEMKKQLDIDEPSDLESYLQKPLKENELLNSYLLLKNI